MPIAQMETLSPTPDSEARTELGRKPVSIACSALSLPDHGSAREHPCLRSIAMATFGYLMSTCLSHRPIHATHAQESCARDAAWSGDSNHAPRAVRTHVQVFQANKAGPHVLVFSFSRRRGEQAFKTAARI